MTPNNRCANPGCDRSPRDTGWCSENCGGLIQAIHNDLHEEECLGYLYCEMKIGGVAEEIITAAVEAAAIAITRKLDEVNPEWRR